MVAQHEVAVARNDELRIGMSVGIVARHIVFVESFSVDIDLPVLNADSVPRNSNNALDVAFRGIARVAEYNNVTALDRLPAIDELVDEDALLVFEAGHHADAFDLHRLVEKDNDERGDGERNQQIARPHRHHGQRARTRFLWNRRYRRLRTRHIRHGNHILSEEHWGGEEGICNLKPKPSTRCCIRLPVETGLTPSPACRPPNSVVGDAASRVSTGNPMRFSRPWVLKPTSPAP